MAAAEPEEQQTTAPADWRSTMLPLLEGLPLLPCGAGKAFKAPITPGGYLMKGWETAAFTPEQILGMNGKVVCVGTRLGPDASGLLAFDVDGASAKALLLERGCDPATTGSWQIHRTTDPNRFKVVFRVEPSLWEQLQSHFHGNSGRTAITTLKKDPAAGIAEAEQLELYWSSGQCVVAGEHRSSGGHYTWQGSPQTVADLPVSWWQMALEVLSHNGQPANNVSNTTTPTTSTGSISQSVKGAAAKVAEAGPPPRSREELVRLVSSYPTILADNGQRNEARDLCAGWLCACADSGIAESEAVAIISEHHPEAADTFEQVERWDFAGFGVESFIAACRDAGVDVSRHDLPKKAAAGGGCVVDGEGSEALKNEARENRKAAAKTLDLSSVLPAPVASELVAGAAAFPVHQSALFAPLITAFSAVVGTRIRVKCKEGHAEPLLFWAGNVQLPSAMKSPVGKQVAISPLKQLRNSDKEAYREKLSQVQDWLLRGGEKGDLLRATGETEEAQALELKMREERSSNPEAFKKRLMAIASDPESVQYVAPAPQRLTKDSTIEALLSVLSDTDGLLLYFDELAGFMESMDRYRNGKGGDRTHYLDLWSGSEIVVNRKAGGVLESDKTCLSLMGFIQPEKLRDLMAEEGSVAAHGGDGFWARWLLCSPPHMDDYYNDKEADLSPLMLRILSTANRLVVRGEQTTLTLSPEAFSLYMNTYNQWVDLGRDELIGFRTQRGKMKGYMARFAGLFHCLDWVYKCMADPSISPKALPTVIGVETMERAVLVSEFFIRQYQLVMSTAGATGMPAWVSRLEARVRDHQLTRISAGEMAKWRIGENAKECNTLIEQLVKKYMLGDMEKGRQGGFVWLPNAKNPHLAAAME